jgi:hypothetical protein
MWYLTHGPEMTAFNPMVAEQYRNDGIPSVPIWQEIIKITKRLNQFGRAGGGLLITPRDLNPDYLAQDEIETQRGEGEDGYLELYQPSIKTPRWINQYRLYDQANMEFAIEVRPPWFHLLRYAFFNKSIDKLPVCSVILTAQRQVDAIRFLVPSLSNQTREYMGNGLLQLPKYLQNQTKAFSVKKEQRDMIFWLWHRVGHKDKKRPLSFQEIANVSRTPKTTIRNAISDFEKRLKKELNGLLLGQLLRMANRLGLGENLTYQFLSEHKLLPPRERGIDGFDDIDKLI